MEKQSLYCYRAIIEKTTDGKWHATVSDLPGCQVSGNSYCNAIEKVKAAIESWLEDLSDAGEAFPQSEIEDREIVIAAEPLLFPGGGSGDENVSVGRSRSRGRSGIIQTRST
jgi:predicted RNase H-like HicB family nuclease